MEAIAQGVLKLYNMSVEERNIIVIKNHSFDKLAENMLNCFNNLVY